MQQSDTETTQVDLSKEANSKEDLGSKSVTTLDINWVPSRELSFSRRKVKSQAML